MRASLIALALGLGSGTAYSQVPSSQIGAVPPPPFVPSQSAPPAAFPVIAPAPPAPVQAPTVILVQVPAAAPVVQAAPVMAFASSQSPAPMSSPFVNPFVTQPTAQAQQGIGTVAMVGATLIADNPWIIDRILAHWGEHLHRRGMPVLRVAPPGTVTAPAASAAVVSLGQPGAFAVVSGPRHQTRFGRWFWGE